jgi:hypothetical protein
MDAKITVNSYSTHSSNPSINYVEKEYTFVGRLNNNYTKYLQP